MGWTVDQGLSGLRGPFEAAAPGLWGLSGGAGTCPSVAIAPCLSLLSFPPVCVVFFPLSPLLPPSLLSAFRIPHPSPEVYANKDPLLSRDPSGRP